MSLSELYNLKPYRRYVFWPLVIFPSLLALFVGGLLYWLLGNQQFVDTQNELIGIATRTANFIPVEVHERLRTPDDMKSEDYHVLELYLQSIMAGNDKIDDIYTLRQTDTDNIMMFVVSGNKTEDKDRNGVIEESEQKAMLGEPFDVSELPDLREGFTHPSADQEITYDKWGVFLSGYAPLKDANGKFVAVLGVDYRAEILADARHTLLRQILAGESITIPLIIILAWILTRRVTRPLEVLIHGLDRIRHGELDFEIPEEGNSEEQVISRLFNTNKEVLMAAGVQRQQNQLEAGGAKVKERKNSQGYLGG